MRKSRQTPRTASKRAGPAAPRPAVSVVIPVHNRADFMASTLQTVLRQSYPALDIVVVDDGSSDDLGAVIHAMGLPQVRLIRLPLRTNAANARNVGAERAGGDYVAFLDSDDTWSEDHLASKIALIARTPGSRGAYGNFFVTDRGRTIRRSRLRPLSNDKAVAEQVFAPGGSPRTSTFVFRRDSFLSVRFDPDLSKHQDWDLFIRFAEQYPLCFDDVPTACLEVGHPGRMSASSVHEGTSRFLRKHKHKLSKRVQGRLYSGIAMTTFLSEGPTPAFCEYYAGIPWDPACGPRVLARKLVLALPGSHRLIAGARLALGAIHGARLRFAGTARDRAPDLGS